MNVHISRHWKEELAWAIDKQLQVISNLKQLCDPKYCILINAHEEMYLILKQEAAHIRTHPCTYVYVHTHTHAYTHTYTNIHTCTHSQRTLPLTATLQAPYRKQVWLSTLMGNTRLNTVVTFGYTDNFQWIISFRTDPDCMKLLSLHNTEITLSREPYYKEYKQNIVIAIM